jgi:2-polyprenyl-6-methoxyphenol hydroxylase-like FAD-dependent oxidoreductase
MQRIIELDSSGNVTRTRDLAISNRNWQHPWHLVPSIRLSERLREAATTQDGPGIPVTVHSAAEVMSVDCDAGRLILADGVLVSADVLIGADGSSVRTRLLLFQ